MYPHLSASCDICYGICRYTSQVPGGQSHLLNVSTLLKIQPWVCYLNNKKKNLFLLWVQYKMSFMGSCVCTRFLVVVLLWRVIETFVDGILLEKLGHGGQAELEVLYELYFLSALCHLTGLNVIIQPCAHVSHLLCYDGLYAFKLWPQINPPTLKLLSVRHLAIARRNVSDTFVKQEVP